MRTILGMGAAAMDTVIVSSTLPRADSFEVVESERLTPGGSCANVLTTLAGLGADCRLIAKIGDDEYGRLLRKNLREEGIDDRLVTTKAGGTTLHTYVLSARNGQHCIFINLGDSLMDLRPDELKPSMLGGVDLFYADLFPGEAAVKMAGMCREKGIPVVICLECPPSMMETMGVSREKILTGLSQADLIVSGRDGYTELSKAKDYTESLEAVYKMFRPRFGAICTAGEEGSLWQDDSETIRKGVYKIAPVDSTGAGDAFLAALIYGYFIEERSKAVSLEVASAVGAMKCLRPGPRIRVSLREAEDFIRAQG